MTRRRRLLFTVTRTSPERLRAAAQSRTAAEMASCGGSAIFGGSTLEVSGRATAPFAAACGAGDAGWAAGAGDDGAAALLGMKPSTLAYQLKSFGIIRRS